MKIVIDMNLSPQWADFLRVDGHECIHWSEIGPPNATDREILLWARDNGFVVFTHDLDFGTIIAATSADSPSVLQLRTQNISPKHIGPFEISALKQFQEPLKQGALISINEKQSRARVLPFSPR